jgi:hypothetical protein
VAEELRDRTYATFDGEEDTPSLEELSRNFLSEQQKSWPELRLAYDSLRGTRYRDIVCNGFSVRLLFNPGRAVNTTAAVSPEKISQRPCFLCIANLPVEQKCILYRHEFLILGNPRPVVPFHLTIAHVSHRPQAITAHTEMFLRIAADIGPGFTVLYNGPRCGASAPDHLHFQAVPSGQMPVEKEIDGRKGFTPTVSRTRVTDVSVRGLAGLGREVILIEGDDVPRLAAAFRDYVHDLADVSTPPGGSAGEPMMNATASFDGRTWRLLVFPRRAHRPAAFYRDDDARLLVSPAVMEMAGIIVTPAERDFDRLDAAAIESLYREVSFIHD